MNKTEVKFNKRYKTGEYEHEDYTVVALLDKKDDAAEAMAELKADVAKAFASKPGAPDKEAEAEEEEDEETTADTEEEEEEAEEEEAEEANEEEEEDEEKEEPVKKGKKFKKKPQSYSRSSEQHKEIFSKMLLSVAPDWKKTDAGKAKAKNASQKMEGKDFLDEGGEVIAEFKTEVKKLMSAKKK